jgi:hypothetical protein
MQPDPEGRSVQVVLDPDDRRDLIQAFSSLADLTAGRAVCHAIPAGSSLYGLGLAVLLGLGKRFDAARVERVQPRCWRLAGIWLAAEEVRDLFVSRAHLLGARHWSALLDLAANRPMRLWLVVHRARLHPAKQQVLAGWQSAVLSAEEFLALWADTRPVGRAADPGDFPHVPADDFPSFRAACRRLLDPPSFARVDAVYEQAFTAARRWVRTTVVDWEDRYGGIDVETVGGFLRDMTVSSTSPSETLVRLRGAQAGFFLHGILLTVDLTSRAMIGETDLRPTLSPAVADHLRGFCTPSWTAAAALTLLAEPPYGALQGMRIGDVAADGTWATIARQRFPIPDYARSLVRAQLLDRRSQLADANAPPLESQPLFPDRGPARARPNRALDALAIWRPPIPMGEGGGGLGRAWLARRGLRVSRIDDPYPWTLGRP